MEVAGLRLSCFVEGFYNRQHVCVGSDKRDAEERRVGEFIIRAFLITEIVAAEHVFHHKGFGKHWNK